MAQDHLELLGELRQIIWIDEGKLPAKQKILQLQVLLPIPIDQPDPYLEQTQTLVHIRQEHQLDGKKMSTLISKINPKPYNSELLPFSNTFTLAVRIQMLI